MYAVPVEIIRRKFQEAEHNFETADDLVNLLNAIMQEQIYLVDPAEIR